MCPLLGGIRLWGDVLWLSHVSKFLADILLIQSNAGNQAEPLVVCPGGQPKTERKKRGRRRERGRQDK